MLVNFNQCSTLFFWDFFCFSHFFVNFHVFFIGRNFFLETFCVLWPHQPHLQNSKRSAETLFFSLVSKELFFESLRFAASTRSSETITMANIRRGFKILFPVSMIISLLFCNYVSYWNWHPIKLWFELQRCDFCSKSRKENGYWQFTKKSKINNNVERNMEIKWTRHGHGNEHGN